MLGYLAAGALIGPYALSIIKNVHGTRMIAEFGVVFLLFNIGLEVTLTSQFCAWLILLVFYNISQLLHGSQLIRGFNCPFSGGIVVQLYSWMLNICVPNLLLIKCSSL